MAYYTYTQKPIGCFVERDTGNYFEYSVNDEPMNFGEDFPHKVWVGGEGFLRYARLALCSRQEDCGCDRGRRRRVWPACNRKMVS